MKARKFGLGCATLIVGFVVLAHLASQNTLQARLNAVAANLVNDYKRDPQGNDIEGIKLGSKAVVSKQYLLFGRPSGKISIYLQHKDGAIEGFEFFYEMDGENWKQTGSGRCTSEQCTAEGLQVLRAIDPAQ